MAVVTTMSAVPVAVANGFVIQVTVDPDGPPVATLATRFASLLLAARQPR